jgi:predicted secreted protein
LSEPVNENLLALIGSRYEPSENAEQGMVGAGGSEVWTFKALATGEAKISMEYSRPWASSEKAVQAFEVIVTIE